MNLLLALFLAVPLAAAPAPDASFDKGLYEEALKGYAPLLKAKDPDARYRALYRTVESEALLFRYAEAAQRLAGMKLPEDPLWRARFALLRAEVGRENLKQYGWAAPQDQEEGQKDQTKLTPAQRRAAIDADFETLWTLRKALTGRPLAEEAYFVDVKNADLERTPTFWDFAARRWLDYLDQDRELASDEAKKRRERLYEETIRLGGSGRAAARELWRVERRLRDASDTKAAAEELRRWVDSFETPAGRALAAFEAARLFDGLARYADAVELCKRAEKDWPKTRSAQRCAQLGARIELPVLQLSAKAAPPPGAGSLSLHSRNLPKIHVRLYRVTPEELLSHPRRWQPDGWGALRSPDEELIRDYARRAPDLAWTDATPAKGPYQYVDAEPAPPQALGTGLYLVLASSDERFKPGSSMLSGAIMNVTRLFLVATSGARGAEADFIVEQPGVPSRRADAFHFYAFDALTGKPVPAALDGFQSVRWQAATRVPLRAGADGMADQALDVSLRYPEGTYAWFDALASHEGSYAYGPGALSFSHSVPAPVELFLETDRPIYRPGQEVRVKLTVVRRVPRGYAAFDAGKTVRLTAADANGQELYNSALTLSSFGSAQARFTIPAGRMLGRYFVAASLEHDGRSYSDSEQFQVEEYKRPEFELTVDEAKGPLRYGREAKASGVVKYYFGGAVQKAPVSWRVYRQAYIPWFCWWWRGLGAGGGRTEVAGGKTTTDDDGRFSLSFTPKPPDESLKDPFPAEFVVEADARDPGGRTISGSRSFRAGAKAYLFGLEPESGFLTPGKASAVPVRLMTLDAQPVAGAGRFTLSRLEGAPKDEQVERHWGGWFPQSPSLEKLYEDVKDGPAVAEGELSFSSAAAARAALPALKDGAYRLTVRAKDPWGGETTQSIVLVAASGGKTPALPSVSIAEHASYVVGETARVLIGSAKLDGAVFVEIWGGQTLLEKRSLKGGGLRVVSIPLTPDHKGGVTVRWFGGGGFRIRSGQASFDVPWKDRGLEVSLKSDAALTPGQKASWSLTVRDADGKPVDGEATLTMFDRSLEYYAKAADAWVRQLYQRWGAPQGAQGTALDFGSYAVPVTEGAISKLLALFRKAIAEPVEPSLRLNRARLFGFYGGGRRRMLMKGLATASPGRANEIAFDAAPAPAAAEMRAEAKLGREDTLREMDKKLPASPPAEAPVQARSNFAETAFFEAQLPVNAGFAAFSFTAPEQLTSWKIKGTVLTKDVKRGTLEASAVTRKDLMVRVQLPRFFREGDEGTIKAVVHNESADELSGTLTLAATEEGEDAAKKLGLTELSRPFTVKPHAAADFSWTLKAPRGQGSFTLRATARAGRLVDAEERELPLLPSRQRLVESVVIALDGTVRKALTLPVYKESDPTRENESMTLQVDPQLALSILNSLPGLVHYPHECTEQLLDRFVPLSIANAFYRKNPALREAVKKIPKRATVTPAWDRHDPRRLMQLMETPWEEASKGRVPYWPMIDMLDPAAVQREVMEALAKLAHTQNSDGGFPWFPGGRSDPYMTLVVLAGFAEAQRYAVDYIPQELFARALSYVNAEIPRHLKPEEDEVALLLYASYVITSFPKSQQGNARAYELAKAWVDYADKHAAAMTPFGKAYAAYVYWRLGEKDKGDLYLSRALDGARQDPIAGVYWTPEKISWLWYNDTVEKHAFFLRTLLALKPHDPRVPGLVQWLLFNRKGNEWKSTKASAAAIYSLLDVLKSRGALDKGDSFLVSWGGRKETAKVEPYDWLEAPLRYTKGPEALGPSDGTATIAKQGPGLAFASLTWIYTTDRPVKASADGMMNLTRRFFLREKAGDGYKLKPLSSGDTVSVGDQIEVHLTVNTRSQFEYVHLKDPKLAGFEAEELTSGWKWDLLSRYEEPRDSLTNFFMDHVPHGEYVLKYRLRPTIAGRFRLGAAVLQSMYAPEFTAHSDSFSLSVKD